MTPEIAFNTTELVWNWEDLNIFIIIHRWFLWVWKIYLKNRDGYSDGKIMILDLFSFLGKTKCYVKYQWIECMLKNAPNAAGRTEGH